jgi:nucleoside-diphosphate-sugar epimerase
MARVLVVGGAGYIGGWLTDKAVEAGHDVRVYDLLLYEERYLKPVDFIAGDVLDYERLHPLLGLG